MTFPISSETFLTLLFEYRYLLLYPVVLIEGPVATMAAGFFVSIGFMNPVIAFFLVVAGDTSSDLFFYFLGRLGTVIPFARRFNFESKKETFIRAFERRGLRVIVLSKFAHALAGFVFWGAGYFRLDVRRVAFYSIIGAALKGALFMYAGYLAGIAFQQYYPYFAYGGLIFSFAIVVITLLVYYFFPRPPLDIDKDASNDTL